jgi:hypothetical protein
MLRNCAPIVKVVDSIFSWSLLAGIGLVAGILWALVICLVLGALEAASLLRQ